MYALALLLLSFVFPGDGSDDPTTLPQLPPPQFGVAVIRDNGELEITSSDVKETWKPFFRSRGTIVEGKTVIDYKSYTMRVYESVPITIKRPPGEYSVWKDAFQVENEKWPSMLKEPEPVVFLEGVGMAAFYWEQLSDTTILVVLKPKESPEVKVDPKDIKAWGDRHKSKGPLPPLSAEASEVWNSGKPVFVETDEEKQEDRWMLVLANGEVGFLKHHRPHNPGAPFLWTYSNWFVETSDALWVATIHQQDDPTPKSEAAKHGWYLTADFTAVPPRVTLTRDSTKRSHWQFETMRPHDPDDRGQFCFVKTKNPAGKDFWLTVGDDAKRYRWGEEIRQPALSPEKKTRFYFADPLDGR